MNDNPDQTALIATAVVVFIGWILVRTIKTKRKVDVQTRIAVTPSFVFGSSRASLRPPNYFGAMIFTSISGWLIGDIVFSMCLGIYVGTSVGVGFIGAIFYIALVPTQFGVSVGKRNYPAYYQLFMGLGIFGLGFFWYMALYNNDCSVGSFYWTKSLIDGLIQR